MGRVLLVEKLEQVLFLIRNEYLDLFEKGTFPTLTLLSNLCRVLRINYNLVKLLGNQNKKPR